MEDILIIDDSEQICSLLAEYVLPELGYRSTVANTGRQGLYRLRQSQPDLILLDLQLPDINGLDLLRLLAQEGYDVPVILMTAHGSENIAVEAFRMGARNYLIKPFSAVEAKAVIDQALRERRLRRDKEQLNHSLQQRVQELTVLYRIGKSVTNLMTQEELLERIVEASVYITRAEEGFLLLRDSQTDELYLRAAKNLGEQRAQSLRMPIDDTLAGQVVRTGRPIRLDRERVGVPLKVKTGFLVRATIQVPLILGHQVIGVLAVDNQQSDRVFSENDQSLLSALADYAAIAIENARLYRQAKQNEERYRKLFDNAYDLIFTLDQDLAITSVNKMGQQLTGYHLKELVGRSLETLCTADSWVDARTALQDLLQGQHIPPFELELLQRDDEPMYLEVSAQLLHDGTNSKELHCIARNLTERRRLEAQLIQSEKLSAIGQLVAGVAHELNNPLTSISGYAQLLLRDTTLGEEIVQDVHQIHTQAERAARIVQNLLIFAREHKPERVVVDLNQVLRSTLALRAYQLRVDNIAVSTHFDPQLPTTVADPFQLQQVFLNLINNAHQAMIAQSTPGTLTITSRAGTSQRRVEGAADDQAQPDILAVEISDTGVGIPERDLKRIFDPFFTTKPVGQGTGLGLSICFGIIQEHGGQIWAESTVGVGTSVYVELPLHIQLPLTNPLQSHTNTNADEIQASYRVLIIDDEEPVGMLFARLLRDLGHTSEVVTSGEAALQALEQEQFDLILSDVKMPGISGFDLYNRLQERDLDFVQRLVFITGDTLSPETQARLAQIGNPYLAKPFAIEQLEAVLRGLAQRRSVHLGTET
ncbi:MAG: response regulator [Chloroflexales bacterium]|nr:response regulator [Chloroflexales bacterium]